MLMPVWLFSTRDNVYFAVLEEVVVISPGRIRTRTLRRPPMDTKPGQQRRHSRYSKEKRAKQSQTGRLLCTQTDRNTIMPSGTISLDFSLLCFSPNIFADKPSPSSCVQGKILPLVLQVATENLFSADEINFGIFLST